MNYFLLVFGLLFQVPHATYRMRGPVFLPDSIVTPGLSATTDTSIICHRSTRTVRHTTVEMKRYVYKEYGIKTRTVGQYEIDHLIPLELGGADSIRNLWPQPANPVPGFHQKDKLEDYLHREVCAGNINVIDAQKMISQDWLSGYLNMPTSQQ